MTFKTLSDDLVRIFEALDSHANEFKCFGADSSEPVTGTFRVNGNGEVRVAMDFSDLRRVKMANFRETLNDAHEIMTQAEALMNETLGNQPLPLSVTEYDLRLQKAVEDGFNSKAAQ